MMEIGAAQIGVGEIGLDKDRFLEGRASEVGATKDDLLEHAAGQVGAGEVHGGKVVLRDHLPALDVID
jgi:hypothetical protein